MSSYFTSLNDKASDKISVKPYSIFITKNTVSLFIRRLPDIINIIIPFFDKHPIL